MKLNLLIVGALILALSSNAFAGADVIIGGKVGEQPGADGAANPLRLTKEGGATTQDLHGRMNEAVVRGKVFTVSGKSVTVTATTDISPLPATTGRCVLGLSNPNGSGVQMSILKINVSTVSGTPGGPFYIDVFTGFTTAAAGTVPVSNLSFAATGSSGKGLAASVPAQAAIATMLRPLGGPAAIAAGAGLYSINDEVAGEIVLQPNSFMCITAHAVGTSHVISGSITFEEITVR